MCQSSLFLSLLRNVLVVCTVRCFMFFFPGLGRPGLTVGACLYNVEEWLDVFQNNANRREVVVSRLLHALSLPLSKRIYYGLVGQPPDRATVFNRVAKDPSSRFTR